MIRFVVAPPLDSPVLVLNRLWQPVNTCTARRAITLLYLGHAQAVSIDEEDQFATYDFQGWLSAATGRDEAVDVVRCVRRALRIPRIIVLAIFDRLPRKEIKFTRHNVFQRDNFTCQYCGGRFENKDLNLDHVIPRDKGGATTWENVVCSCIRCNTRKANKLPREARMIPLREPRAPRWRPFFSALGAGVPGIASGQVGHESWRHFVELPVGRVELSG